MKTLAITSIALAILCTLSGCTTSQTLLSQFDKNVPLPPSVARAQYGVCRDCQAYGVQPNCIECRRVQAERRTAAGLGNTSFQRKYANAPATQDQRQYRPQYQPNYQPEYQREYQQPQYQQPAPSSFNRQVPIRSNSNTIPRGRVTALGNPYPVKWLAPMDTTGNPELDLIIRTKQLDMVTHDKDLAVAYFDYLDNRNNRNQEITRDPFKWARAQNNQTRRQTAGIQTQNSGYTALGY